MDRDAAEAFRYEMRADFDRPDLLRTERVEIQKGARVYKGATLLMFGDKITGEVKKTICQIGSWKRKLGDRGGYDFESPTNFWRCEGEEVNRLKALLNREFPETGQYQLASHGSSIADLLNVVENGQVDPEVVRRFVAALASNREASQILAGLNEAMLLASVIDRAKQSAVLESLRKLVEDPQTREPDIQALLKDTSWIFGGRYVGQAARRTLAVGDQYDFPLLRGDGTLHIVEIKQANIPKLVLKHRDNLIVGSEVNQAVGQVLNYLRTLDEHRNTILADLRIDCRRASATIIIGHPQFVVPAISSAQVSETIRTYNSHLSRVEVLTYKDLIEGAEQSLALSQDPTYIADEDYVLDGGWPSEWSDEPPF